MKTGLYRVTDALSMGRLWGLLLGLLWSVSGCGTWGTASSSSEPSCCRALNAGRIREAQPAVFALGSAQERRLENDFGETVSLADFQGHPLLVSIFFSSCELLCPITVANLQRVHASLSSATKADVRVVLISFDSSRDTVEKLHAFRLTHHLPSNSWSLLRGEPATISRLVQDLGMQFQSMGHGRFAHSTQILALDREGYVIHRTTHLHAGLDELVRSLKSLPPPSTSERLSLFEFSSPTPPLGSSLRP